MAKQNKKVAAKKKPVVKSKTSQQKKVIGKPFEKGKPKTGGSKKGVQNKVTRTIKEAIAHALGMTQDNLPGWLIKAGSRSGTSGVFAFTALAEFVLPKMSRTEHTGADGQAMQMVVVTADEAARLQLDKLGPAAAVPLIGSGAPAESTDDIDDEDDID